MKTVKYSLETPKGKLEYSVCGTGNPNIVLINGSSGPIEGWMKIIEEISKFSSVFAYNRFGVGGSDKPKEPQDGMAIVKTLREALTIAGVAPPFLLVGHSLGGLYANLFARLYPNEAAGLVFIESSHPKDLHLNQYQGKTVKAINKVFTMGDFLFFYKQFHEVNFVEQTVDQLRENNSFPDIPVYVLTGGRKSRMMPEDIFKKRLNHQAELLSLSSNSKHIIAEKSGHFPQLSEPAVVIEAIKDCVNQINNTTDAKLL